MLTEEEKGEIEYMTSYMIASEYTKADAMAAIERRFPELASQAVNFAKQAWNKFLGALPDEERKVFLQRTGEMYFNFQKNWPWLLVGIGGILLFARFLKR